MRRLQIPVRLAIAMTINKSQGQTFDRIRIMLPESVFAHKQYFDAFSRVRSFDCAKEIVTNIPASQNRLSRFLGHAVTYTKNVVYKSIFEYSILIII